jgi:flagellar biogenesis protein FliO
MTRRAALLALIFVVVYLVARLISEAVIGRGL